MAHITVVGLGPGEPQYLTREAWQILSECDEIWVRTLKHPVLAHLPAHLVVHSFDSLYETADTFEHVYAEIVTQILALSRRTDGVCYAVPGHPMVGEATVAQLLATARAQQIPVQIVAGLSFFEPVLVALSLDALDGLQIVDALDVVALYHPPLNPDMPALIAQVYSRTVASDLKLLLMNQYPDEHSVALVDAAGTGAELVTWMPLYEIDRQQATPLTSLYVPPLPQVSSFEGFQQTVARLRAPDGCPWDREQTHQSLRANLLEETYEVLAALDADDTDALREELGDLLLQIVLHTQIAVEDGAFLMPEVISGIDTKLKRRHPHVWGDVQVGDSAEVIVNWEAIKRHERETKGNVARSMLDGVPKALPGLAQAVEYGGRVARIGLDVDDNAHSFLDKEVVDLSVPVRRACHECLEHLESFSHTATEATSVFVLGEVLFEIANWARRQHLDPESALRLVNQQLLAQVKRFEGELRARELQLELLNPAEIRQLWREVI
ncbi:MAG TPA: nucleoside triphosphate pyrophosphohydrolase [Anaerolineae bacterium]|nr:nucleoside triphosphate pyrophosphohydrolase [Anaerolineae bacterium]